LTLVGPSFAVSNNWSFHIVQTVCISDLTKGWEHDHTFSLSAGSNFTLIYTSTFPVHNRLLLVAADVLVDIKATFCDLALMKLLQ